MYEILYAIAAIVTITGGVVGIYKLIKSKPSKENKIILEIPPNHLNGLIISLRNVHCELFSAKTSFGLDQNKIQNAEDFLNDAVYHLQSHNPKDEKNLNSLVTVRYYLEKYTLPYRNGATFSERKPLEDSIKLLEHIGKSFGADLRPA